MACTRKTKNAASSGAVSTVFAVPDAAPAAETDAAPLTETAADTAAQTSEPAETASDWTEVPMRRYAHPIPASCGFWDCQSCPCQSCPCQSCACQSAEQTACLARLLRQQRDLLEEIRTLLMQIFPRL